MSRVIADSMWGERDVDDASEALKLLHRLRVFVMCTMAADPSNRDVMLATVQQIEQRVRAALVAS